MIYIVPIIFLRIFLFVLMSFNKWRDFLLHCYLYILPLIQKVFECCLLLYAGILFVINIIVKHFLYPFHIVDAKSCVHMRVECFSFNQNYAERYFLLKIKMK